jgi:PAS domain S-box-containing protein
MKFEHPVKNSLHFIPGTGETAGLVQSVDWAATSLGSIDKWPQSLRTVAGICLNSANPVVLLWGKDFIQIYNDAYIPLVGLKHPVSFGRPVSETWPEVWPGALPRLEQIMKEGLSFSYENKLFLLHRNGFPEECYFSYCQVPVHDDSGNVGGIFVSMQETTYEVLRHRQMKTLEMLRQNISGAVEYESLYRLAATTLAGNPEDFPFVLIYNGGNEMMFREVTGMAADTGFPGVIDLNGGDGWPGAGQEIFSEGNTLLTDTGAIAQRGDKDIPAKCLLVPVMSRNRNTPPAFLAIGLNPLRQPDPEYLNFFRLVAETISTEAFNLSVNKAERKKGRTIMNMFSNAPVALMLLKGDDYIVEYANTKMLELWHRSPEEELFRSIFDILPETSGQGFREMMDDVRRTGKAYVAHEYPVVLKRAGVPATIYVNFVFEPYREDDGSIDGVIVVASDITGEVLSRQEIDEKEERLRLAITSTNLGTWDFRPLEGKLSWSDECRQIYRVPPDKEIDFELFSELLYPEDAERVQEAIRQAMDPSGNGAYDIDYRIIRYTDRAVRWISVIGKVYFTELGEPGRFIGTVVDITDRKQQEEMLKESIAMLRDSEKRYRDLINNLPSGMCVCDPEGNILFYNETAVRLWGRAPRRGKDKWCGSFKCLHTSGRPLEEQEMPLAVVLNRRDWEKGTEIIIEQPGGDRCHVIPHPRPIYDAMGNLTGAVNILLDVTENKLAEKALRESEVRLRLATEGTRLATWDLDLVTRDIIYSPRLAEIFGHDQYYRLTHEQMREQIHPDDRKEVVEKAFEDAMISGYYSYEARVVRPDHSIGWIRTQGKVVFDNDRQPLRMLGTMMDITELKQAEEALKESERRFRTVADTAPVMIWMSDPEGACIFLNRCWSEYTGISLREGLGGGWVNPVHPDDYSSVSAGFRAAILNRSEYNAEFRLRRSDGEYRWILDHAVPRYGPDGIFLGYIGTCIDTHEQKNAKEELEKRVEMRTQQLQLANEALLKTNQQLEQFAYVSSHDLQEPLRKIQVFSDYVMNRIAQPETMTDPEAVKYLQKVMTSANRMSGLIHDLLNYSRLNITDQKFVEVDLNQVLQYVKEDFEALLLQKGGKITNGVLPVIQGIPVQMNQLFYNLISNALKFSDGRPEISITAGRVKAGAAPGLKHISNDGEFHLISFSDNGIGFDQQYAETIFTLFQRLNDRDKYGGTGIGLALCKKIAENHHGMIEARSKPGQGATFMIYLPA